MVEDNMQNAQNVFHENWAWGNGNESVERTLVKNKHSYGSRLEKDTIICGNTKFEITYSDPEILALKLSKDNAVYEATLKKQYMYNILMSEKLTEQHILHADISHTATTEADNIESPLGKGITSRHSKNVSDFTEIHTVNFPDNSHCTFAISNLGCSSIVLTNNKNDITVIEFGKYIDSAPQRKFMPAGRDSGRASVTAQKRYHTHHHM